jgi:hypothetical protein
LTRAEFQRLANDWIADAKALLAARRWGAAYYVAGYAVECGLKSCILVRLAGKVEIIFEDRRYLEKCWTHDLNQLLELAGLEAALDVDTAADRELADNWDTAKDWTEESRYSRKSRLEAQRLYEAITDRKHGVLPWIKARW